MQDCEVCGNESDRLVKRKIAGAVVYVCPGCADLGEPIREERKKVVQNYQKRNTGTFQKMYQDPDAPRPTYHRSSSSARPKRENVADFRVAGNYQEVLTKLRQNLKMDPQEFAAEFQIKENYYKRIEKGATALPVKLAKRIEGKYHVKLLEKEDYEEEDDLSKYMKTSKSPSESLVYFKKKGQKPDYEQI